MDDGLEERLQKSARILREWGWLGPLSTRPDELIVILREEARSLIEMGLRHPAHARRIGRLIVAYRRLLDRISTHHQHAA